MVRAVAETSRREVEESMVMESSICEFFAAAVKPKEENGEDRITPRWMVGRQTSVGEVNKRQIANTTFDHPKKNGMMMRRVLVVWRSERFFTRWLRRSHWCKFIDTLEQSVHLIASR